MFGAVVGAGILLILGFGVLFLSRLDIQQNLDEYLVREGLPPTARYDSRGWMALEFIGGAALTLAIIVLLERLTTTGREWLRTVTTLALIGGIVLGLVQTLDGLVNVSPDGIVGAVYPAYFFPLNLAMGLLALAVYVPAVIMVTAGGPRAARVAGR
ncbi:hypothetical protein Vau01_083010 [Virgisporangium aurantiacum]|uniref:Uncharacterized protein n=2 Tax=Virgisporangium aurantiacum TaxID=175570 RepID=A0A8J3ZFS2_9ACTN|nr:hypothetical protein Vau01_083010 [Virgisporangium aurantiacum]